MSGLDRMREIAREIEAAAIARLDAARRDCEGFAPQAFTRRCRVAGERVAELAVQRQCGFEVRDEQTPLGYMRRSFFKGGRLLATFIWDEMSPSGMPYPRRCSTFPPKRVTK